MSKFVGNSLQVLTSTASFAHYFRETFFPEVISNNYNKILNTRNLGRYAPKFLAPAEGWWPSATDWQGLNFFILKKLKISENVLQKSL